MTQTHLKNCTGHILVNQELAYLITMQITCSTEQWLSLIQCTWYFPSNLITNLLKGKHAMKFLENGLRKVSSALKLASRHLSHQYNEHCIDFWRFCHLEMQSRPRLFVGNRPNWLSDSTVLSTGAEFHNQ